MIFAHPIPTSPVTLNLFQGLSSRKFGVSRMGTKLAVEPAISRSGHWDKWALKQVQGDERREC